ncbi:MAG: hypothetical protein QOD66_232 [Solirubrobacteraceae bacterium]|jgi:hypothetical protein|nr:hypothetical protein [Solirubrobacteraceae bacterium]
MEESNIPGHDRGDEDDALRRLEARLDRASGAAERLIAEAARASISSAGRVADAASRAARAPSPPPGGPGGLGGSRPGGAPGPQPPPAGWEVPGDDARSGADLEVLAQVIQSLRELIPTELQRRVTDALRELLLALRALIDWYLERVEKRRAAPAEVQDIPIL